MARDTGAGAEEESAGERQLCEEGEEGGREAVKG